MGVLGTSEILILVVVVLVLFGASRFPKVARGARQSLTILRRDFRGNDKAGKPGKADKLDKAADSVPAAAEPDRSAAPVTVTASAATSGARRTAGES